MQDRIRCEISILISFVNIPERSSVTTGIIERAKLEDLFVVYLHSLPNVGDTIGINTPDHNGIDFWARVINVVVYPSSDKCEPIAILEVVPLCMLYCSGLG